MCVIFINEYLTPHTPPYPHTLHPAPFVTHVQNYSGYVHINLHCFVQPRLYLSLPLNTRGRLNLKSRVKYPQN